MKISIDCYPCLVQQAVDGAKRFAASDAEREQIVREAVALLGDFDRSKASPEMGGVISRIVARVVGESDPYLGLKRRSNELVLAALPGLRELMARADDPFEAAVRLAIAGNIIDVSAPGGCTDGRLENLFREALHRPLRGALSDDVIGKFRDLSERAENILYLADNAGEIVVDRLLIEQLPQGRVTLAVRGGPTINDALVEDAEVAGIGEVAKIITNGSDLPGTVLTECSAAFRQAFEAADLIISKGQGNYETLGKPAKDLCVLTMTKCPVVARDFGVPEGSFVVRLTRS